MPARKSTCLLCGTEYDVCKLCPEVRKYRPWRVDYDSPRHFQIHAIVKEVRAGILKHDEAKEQLAALNVTVDEIKTFVPSVQKILMPIFNTEPQVTPVEPEQPTIQEKVEAVVEEAGIEPPVQQKPAIPAIMQQKMEQRNANFKHRRK